MKTAARQNALNHARTRWKISWFHGAPPRGCYPRYQMIIGGNFLLKIPPSLYVNPTMREFLKGISNIIRNISLNLKSGVKPLTLDFKNSLQGKTASNLPVQHVASASLTPLLPEIPGPSKIGGVKPANQISSNFNLYKFPIAIGKMYNLKIGKNRFTLISQKTQF